MSAVGSAGRGVAVVSGGSAGVGRAVVRELSRAGLDVAVLARGRAGLEAAAVDVESRGRRCVAIETDAGDLDQVRADVGKIEAELGAIDIWINVAFVGALRYFWDTSPELYEQITRVTYLGQVNGTRAALEVMRPRDRGCIIQVGSALGYRGIPLQAAYCGAKHAVVGFTESVRTELKHERSNVHVGMVQLPGVNTPQFDWNDSQFDEHPMPVPPIFQPDVAARVIRYAAEHGRRNMWVGLPTAYTILGNRVAPWFLDWYLSRTGVDSQLADDAGPRLPSNAFTPRDDLHDAGARGSFTQKAHDRDPWSAISMRRGVALSAVAFAALLGWRGRR